MVKQLLRHARGGIKNLVRRVALRHRFLVLFIPCAAMGRSDAVAALSKLVAKLLRKRYRNHNLHGDFPSFATFLSSVGLRNVPSRLVLFGHPNSRTDAFAASNSHGETISLNAEWWRASVEYECVIAQVCRGTTILRQPAFLEVFPNWVSYKRDITMYIGSPRAHERWARVDAEIADAAWTSDSATTAEARIRAVYLQAFAEIRDSYDRRGGDLLTLGYFQNCLDSLESVDRNLDP